jgi:anti-sigma regulatory factor (Ser/Thr protein kinase)
MDPPDRGDAARPWGSVLVRRATEVFPPTRSAPRHVRAFVGDALRSWGYGRLCETAELLVSEIVTNVVMHAGTSGLVTAPAHPAGVRIEVTDAGRDLPGQRRPEPREPEGRGLGIVAALARDWGVDVGPDETKTVWFELDDADPAR